MDVVVTVKDPVIKEEEMKEMILMDMTLESLYSPPEAWTIQSAPQYTYTVATPVPISAEVRTKGLCVSVQILFVIRECCTSFRQNFVFLIQKDNCIVFAGGQLKLSADKDVQNKEKKWPVPGNAQGNAVYIPNRLVTQTAGKISLDNETKETVLTDVMICLMTTLKSLSSDSLHRLVWKRMTATSRAETTKNTE